MNPARGPARKASVLFGAILLFFGTILQIGWFFSPNWAPFGVGPSVTAAGMLVLLVHSVPRLGSMVRDMRLRHGTRGLHYVARAFLRRGLTITLAFSGAFGVLYASAALDACTGATAMLAALVAYILYTLRRRPSAILLLRPFDTEPARRFATEYLETVCHEYGVVITLPDGHLYAGRHQRPAVLVALALFGPFLIIAPMILKIGHAAFYAWWDEHGLPGATPWVLLWCVSVPASMWVYRSGVLDTARMTADEAAYQAVKLARSRWWPMFTGSMLTIRTAEATWKSLVQALLLRVDLVVIDWTDNAEGVREEYRMIESISELEPWRCLEVVAESSPTERDDAFRYSNDEAAALHLRARLEALIARPDLARRPRPAPLDGTRKGMAPGPSPTLQPLGNTAGMDVARRWLAAWDVISRSEASGWLGVLVLLAVLSVSGAAVLESEVLGAPSSPIYRVGRIEGGIVEDFMVLTMGMIGAMAAFVAHRSLLYGLRLARSRVNPIRPVVVAIGGGLAAACWCIGGWFGLAVLLDSPIDQAIPRALVAAAQSVNLFLSESPGLLWGLLSGEPSPSRQPMRLTFAALCFIVPSIIYALHTAIAEASCRAGMKGPHK